MSHTLRIAKLLGLAGPGRSSVPGSRLDVVRGVFEFDRIAVHKAIAAMPLDVQPALRAELDLVLAKAVEFGVKVVDVSAPPVLAERSGVWLN